MTKIKSKQGWEGKMDGLVIDFFDEISPPPKGEAHTWLIPLMVELKILTEELLTEQKAEIRKEIVKLRLEFANTPIRERGTGWDWLGKLDKLLKPSNYNDLKRNPRKT